MYGVINNKGEFIQLSETLRGAKHIATRNGYNRIGRMSYINNMLIETWTKSDKGWGKDVNFSTNN